MPASTATPTSSNGSDMLSAHARLVKEYDHTSGASKAVVSGKLRKLELEMEFQGVEYEPWVKPTAYTQKWTMSESELVQRITGMRAIATNPDKRDFIREAAEREVESLEAQAGKRGVKVPA